MTDSNKILVAYASHASSTKGVAQAIGATLAENGAQVDVLPMDEVQDLSPYRAVVAGSAIQGSKWLPEAMDFVLTNQDALSQKPFASFLVCMTMVLTKGEITEELRGLMEPVRQVIEPVKEGYFAGALDLSKVESFWVRLGFRISILLRIWKEGDHRDWDAINAWAEELKSEPGFATSPPKK